MGRPNHRESWRAIYFSSVNFPVNGIFCPFITAGGYRLEVQSGNGLAASTETEIEPV